MAETEDRTFVITDEDGDTDEIVAPAALLEALDEGDDSDSVIVGDVAQMALTGQSHAMVHHSTGGDIPDELVEADDRMQELFEQRFGSSYAEATGHSH